MASVLPDTIRAILQKSQGEGTPRLSERDDGMRNWRKGPSGSSSIHEIFGNPVIIIAVCFRIVNAIEENSGIGIFLYIGATNVILLNIFLQFAIVGKLFARFSSLWDFKFWKECRDISCTMQFLKSRYVILHAYKSRIPRRLFYPRF